MNVQVSRDNGHLLLWITSALLLLGVLLGDAAIIAWYASFANVWQLLGSFFSFLMIAAGLLFTVWRMRR
jgi:hypothetical protein